MPYDSQERLTVTADERLDDMDMIALTRDLCTFRTAVVADEKEALFAKVVALSCSTA